MAGSVTDPRTGVGSALRRAREVRGLSLDEAARDTRLRVDQLDALEREDFDVLPGEVYVRASLRTYASYLGIDPAKVAEVYARAAEEVQQAPPSAKLGRVERMIAASRIRDNQRFLLIAAASILLVLLALGLLSQGEAAPPAAELASTTPSPIPDDPTIRAVLATRGDVAVEAEADGVTTTYALRPGETITLVALERLVFRVDDGGLVDVSVNGKDETEGRRGSPHTYRFTFGDDGGQTSSNG
ncbi:MAG TPA: helix-turn-helix transcriptional regulator [Actinomycetota bacterium]|nr:helix-turn-helix transcriptional regulator [Actinomycetota bacterium]